LRGEKPKGDGGKLEFESEGGPEPKSEGEVAPDFNSRFGA